MLDWKTPPPMVPDPAPGDHAGHGPAQHGSARPGHSMASTSQHPTLQDFEALAPQAGPGTPLFRQAERQLGQISNFLFYSLPNPTEANEPMFLDEHLIGVRVHEMLHRFETPQRATSQGLQIDNRIGQPAAQVHMTWRPIPDDFEAYPGVDIPPTPLDPTRSQRFMMHDGHFFFNDHLGTGLRGFGTGRTYPVVVDGKPQLRIAAVVDVVEGMGALAGAQGMLLVNGHIQPPTGLALTILMRVTDPRGRFVPTGPLTPLVQIPNPSPDDLYLVFYADSDPNDPVKLEISPEGKFLGARGPQRMRLLDIVFDDGDGEGLHSASTLGAKVGSMNAMAWFDPFDTPLPHPFQTTDGVFTLHDGSGQELGTLDANMTEGRALPTSFPGLPLPVYRVGGIAPVTGGTGLFDGVTGLFTVDSFISLVPNVISAVFVLHLTDPSKAVRQRLLGGHR